MTKNKEIKIKAVSLLVERAAKLGIKQPTIQQHIRRHGVLAVLMQINNLAYAIAIGKASENPINNPEAWLYSALSKNYRETR